jgi:hypothetical protein
MKSFKKYPMAGPKWYEKFEEVPRWQDQTGMKRLKKYPMAGQGW